MGVRDPETGKDRKGERERQRNRVGEARGWGRESKGVKSPGQKSRFTRGPSAQETLSGETKETDVGAERQGEPSRGSPPRENGAGGGGAAGRGLKRDKERQRQGTSHAKAGRGPEVGEPGALWGFQGTPRDLGDSNV